jgi:hypothetical protein
MRTLTQMDGCERQLSHSIVALKRVFCFTLPMLKEVRFAENEGIAGDEELVHDCKKVVHKHAHTRGRAVPIGIVGWSSTTRLRLVASELMEP